MKSYSDDAVTKADLQHIAFTTEQSISKVDEKQTNQIKQLRWWLAGAFITNLAFTVGFCVWHCARM